MLWSGQVWHLSSPLRCLYLPGGQTVKQRKTIIFSSVRWLFKAHQKMRSAAAPFRGAVKRVEKSLLPPFSVQKEGREREAWTQYTRRYFGKDSYSFKTQREREKSSIERRRKHSQRMGFFSSFSLLPGRRPFSMSKKLSDNCYKEKKKGPSLSV